MHKNLDDCQSLTNFAIVFMVLDLRLERIDCRETNNPLFFCIFTHYSRFAARQQNHGVMLTQQETRGDRRTTAQHGKFILLCGTRLHTTTPQAPGHWEILTRQNFRLIRQKICLISRARSARNSVAFRRKRTTVPPGADIRFRRNASVRSTLFAVVSSFFSFRTGFSVVAIKMAPHTRCAVRCKLHGWRNVTILLIYHKRQLKYRQHQEKLLSLWNEGESYGKF